MAIAKRKNPDYWNKAKRHLMKADPTLGRIIETYKGEALASRGSAFFSLARAIVGQQISVKAAESVWNKLTAGLFSPLKEASAYSDQHIVSPPPLRGRIKEGGGPQPTILPLASPHPHLPPQGGKEYKGNRATTHPKAEGITPQAILDSDTALLRSFGLSGQKVIYLKELSQFFAARARHNWHQKSDAEVITDLISIKGIGRWSAEMFLIFHLMRPDVFPIADLGLRKAIELHYNKGEKMAPADMLALSERWRPYRTVSTWYLWRSLDPVPVEY